MKTIQSYVKDEEFIKLINRLLDREDLYRALQTDYLNTVKERDKWMNKALSYKSGSKREIGKLKEEISFLKEQILSYEKQNKNIKNIKKDLEIELISALNLIEDIRNKSKTKETEDLIKKWKEE